MPVNLIDNSLVVATLLCIIGLRIWII